MRTKTSGNAGIWLAWILLATSILGLGACQTAAERRFQAANRYMEGQGEPEIKRQRKAEKLAGLRPTGAEESWRWFIQRRRTTTGVTPIAYREQSLATSRRTCQALATSVGADWAFVGPITNGAVVANGRIVDLAVHPTNDQIVYAATASGGVWKTTDQGRNWSNLTDNKLPTLGCGSIVMEPGNPNTLLVGLGEGMTVHANFLEPLGTGVYKTKDGGATWALLPGTGNGVMQFVVDIRYAGDAKTLLVAAAGGQGGAGAGLWRSTDSGATWTKKWATCTWSISVDPANAKKVVATTREYDSTEKKYRARIHYSTDGGVNFTAAAIPENVDSMRAELARATAPNSGTLFALLAKNNHTVFGIWKSTNGGANWTATDLGGIPTDQDGRPGQMNYNNCIAVAPGSAATLYFGSNLRAYKSTDGAATWKPYTDWDYANPGWQDDGLGKVHADHHAIAFGASANTVYMATDGGFFVSTDGAKTFTERNNGLCCTQIYRIANHPSIENALIMGCQDNCKFLRKSNGSWHHWPNTFGDCMEVVSYPSDPAVFMGCNYNGVSMKFTTDAAATPNWNYLRMYDQYENGIPSAERGAWVTPFLVDPLHPENIWTLLQSVYRRPYHATEVRNWTRVKALQDLSSDSFEYLELSCGPTNRQMYVGYQRYDQQGQLVSGILRADIGDGTADLAANSVDVPKPRTGYIGAIVCDPVDNDTLWVSYTDFYDPYASNSRVYKSTDKGQTWTDKTGNLPKSLPVSALFVDPKNTKVVVAGTDLGCYRTDDGGATWYTYNSGLPNTVVSDLAYYAPTRKLRAGTFGRGIWETALDGKPGMAVSPAALTFSGSARTTQASAAPVPAPARAPAGVQQVTVLQDDFEAASLKAGWSVTGDPTWGINNYYSHAGARGVWSCAGGTNGITPPGYYPAGMEARLVYGPMNLADATAASLVFWEAHDLDVFGSGEFQVYVSDSAAFPAATTRGWEPYWYSSSGGTGEFEEITLDLAAVGPVWDTLSYLGKPAVYLMFRFASGTYGDSNQGAAIDDVLVVKTADVPDQPLPAPAGVSASKDRIGKVRVQWNAVAGATHYRVYRAPANDSAQAAAIGDWQATSPYDDTNVNPGTSYYYFVKAQANGARTSAFSASARGVALADPNVLPPQTVTITNPGPGALIVSAITKQKNSAWLSFSLSGALPLTIPAGGKAQLTVRASKSGLALGTYSDRLLLGNNTSKLNPFPNAVLVTLEISSTGVRTGTWQGYE